jgi:LPXTG-site transpeptidase (sortase) family protein
MYMKVIVAYLSKFCYNINIRSLRLGGIRGVFVGRFMRRLPILLLIMSVFIGAAGFVSSALLMRPVYSSEKPVAEHAEVASSPLASPSPVPATAPSEATLSQPAVVVAQVSKQVPAAVKGNTLSIPSIAFQGSIVDVGVTADNAIDVPATKVGRWIGSAQPGSPGAVFLDGHVEGVFAGLKRLSVGQTITMTYGGQTFNYKVASTEVVDLATIDMNRALRVYGGASEGLNIMTCAGTYISSAGTYDKRLIVYAVRSN